MERTDNKLPLIEAHIILYGLLTISGVAMAISGYYTVLEVMIVHKEIKKHNAWIHKQLKEIRNGKDI